MLSVTQDARKKKKEQCIISSEAAHYSIGPFELVCQPQSVTGPASWTSSVDLFLHPTQWLARGLKNEAHVRIPTASRRSWSSSQIRTASPAPHCGQLDHDPEAEDSIPGSGRFQSQAEERGRSVRFSSRMCARRPICQVPRLHQPPSRAPFPAWRRGTGPTHAQTNTPESSSNVKFRLHGSVKVFFLAIADIKGCFFSLTDNYLPSPGEPGSAPPFINSLSACSAAWMRDETPW